MSEIKTGKTTKPALNISPEEMAAYRATAQKRWAAEQRALAQRKRRAWALARQAADLLKTQFGATRVVLFGSLLDDDCFTRWSDVDIAAWGIAPAETFQAIGAVLDLSADIEVSLVDVNTCSSSLLEVIEQEGAPL